MRINNQKRIKFYIDLVYSLLFIGLLCSFMLVLVPIHKIVNQISPFVLVGIFLTLIIAVYSFGHQQFDYNSDGEVLNLGTQDVFWVKYFPQKRSLVDFPKRKLKDFNISNKIFRKDLELFVESKRSKKGYVKLTFNITFLSQSEINDLKLSLSRTIKKNQENKLKRSV